MCGYGSPVPKPSLHMQRVFCLHVRDQLEGLGNRLLVHSPIKYILYTSADKISVPAGIALCVDKSIISIKGLPIASNTHWTVAAECR